MQLIFGRTPKKARPPQRYGEFQELFAAVKEHRYDWVGIPASEVVGHKLDDRATRLRKIALDLGETVQVIAEKGEAGEPDILFVRQRTEEETKHLTERAKRQVEQRKKNNSKTGPKPKVQAQPVAQAAAKPPAQAIIQALAKPVVTQAVPQPVVSAATKPVPVPPTPAPAPAPPPATQTPVTTSTVPPIQRLPSPESVPDFVPVVDGLRGKMHDALVKLLTYGGDPDEYQVLEFPFKSQRVKSASAELMAMAKTLAPGYTVDCDIEENCCYVRLLKADQQQPA